MASLPLDERGFPVPKFVRWIDGKPDFRVINPEHFNRAVRGACWICGERLGSFKSYVIGPMCGVNRINSEPPSHQECAEFAAKTCPFLSMPLAKRRPLPGDTNKLEAPGFMIPHNPQACAVWTTRSPVKPFKARMGGEGYLFNIGEPTSVQWFHRGRRATREEVDAALERGLPQLYRVAENAEAVREINRKVAELQPYLPQAA